MKKKETEWCLFLDRDGVINKRIHNDYVKTWDEFIFLPFVLNTLKKLNPLFKYVFIVTNQQGIGKGMMTIETLSAIHKKLKKTIRKRGGHIDEIFYCPARAEDISARCRKPDIGMGLEAKLKYPDINFQKSIMIGDSSSDILFGKNLGMISIYIGSGSNDRSIAADYYCKNLHEFYLTFVSSIIKEN